MRRRLWPTFLLLAGSGCGAAPHMDIPGDPYEIPYERLSETQREKIRRVLDAPSAMVPLERTPVRSRIDVYEFLLDELPFTAGVVRELGRATYKIWRTPVTSDATEEERRTWRRRYLFDDGAGLRLQAELVYRDASRSIYYTYGKYGLGLFTVGGRSVIITIYREERGVLMTEARVYTQVEGKALEAVAATLKGVLESTVRQKAFVFIDAAKFVAELAAERPDDLVTAVRGSDEVDAEVLEDFRARFLR